MNFKKGDKIKLRRDIYRKDGLYAVGEETGTIVETFCLEKYKHSKHRTWHAKVLMRHDGKIKTFRLTSIKKDQCNEHRV